MAVRSTGVPTVRLLAELGSARAVRSGSDGCLACVRVLHQSVACGGEAGRRRVLVRGNAPGLPPADEWFEIMAEVARSRRTRRPCWAGQPQGVGCHAYTRPGIARHAIDPGRTPPTPGQGRRCRSVRCGGSPWGGVQERVRCAPKETAPWGAVGSRRRGPLRPPWQYAARRSARRCTPIPPAPHRYAHPAAVSQ